MEAVDFSGAVKPAIKFGPDAGMYNEWSQKPAVRRAETRRRD